jgi:glycosyltransferase involved in cell wall biosynthesis
MQGHPYLALAYEHAYDYVLTCSQKMADWLLGMGVPSAKLCAIPNAHGYVVSEQERDRIVAARHAFDGTRKLRVLFIGRFDRQKGLERAVKQAQLAATNGLAIEWRFVGSRVVGDDVDEATAKTLASLSVPAAYETRKLNEHFAWADILFVPSHWEGLPLTILEAMRLGCVPFATRVGAVEEAIADGINGLLIQDYNDQTVHDTFREILKGKLSLTSMISGGKNTSYSRTWATAAQAFPLVKQGYKLKT